MFLNLVYQVQKALRLINGGTGNEYGLARGTVFRALQYSGGSTLAVGSTVKRAPYNYTSVTVTTDTDDIVLGVSVGTFSESDDSIDPDTPTPSNGSVAVAVSGIVNVLLGADVTAGQYAYAHATDGTAYSVATQAGASFGQFLTSGTTGNKAKVLLGRTAGSGAHATAHEPGGSDAMAVDAAAATGSLRTIGTGALQAAAGNHAHDAIVLMTDGITSPPEPLWNEAGDDWLYEG